MGDRILFWLGVLGATWGGLNAIACLLVGAWLAAFVLALLCALSAAVAWSSHDDINAPGSDREEPTP